MHSLRAVLILLSAMVVVAAGTASAQPAHRAKMTAGRKQVEKAYAFQAKLDSGKVTIKEVIGNWQKTARDPEVREDKDALGIAYGCEGMLELQDGRDLVADSLLKRAKPLFRIRQSKAYFLVGLADLEQKLDHSKPAMEDYSEILRTMDSMPQLEEIQFYLQSGYADYAYGIVAALGIGTIAIHHPKFRNEAVTLLNEAYTKHSQDALGAMAIVALEHADPAKAEDYKFKLDLLCSRKPELRKVSDKFEKQF